MNMPRLEQVVGTKKQRTRNFVRQSMVNSMTNIVTFCEPEKLKAAMKSATEEHE